MDTSLTEWLTGWGQAEYTSLGEWIVGALGRPSPPAWASDSWDRCRLRPVAGTPVSMVSRFTDLMVR